VQQLWLEAFPGSFKMLNRLTFPWRQLLCPFCFRQFHLADVGFRCSSCPAEPDTVLHQHLGAKGPPPMLGPITFPTRNAIEKLVSRFTVPRAWPCSKTATQTTTVHGATVQGATASPPASPTACGKACHHRVCPHCHSELASHFGRVNHKVVAVIGARDAGKTHFVTVLINELRKRAPQLMNATMSSQGDETRKLYETFYYNPLYVGKQLLPPTERAATNPRKPLFYRLEFKRQLFWLPFVRWRTTVNLVFFDAAGEDITDERTLQLHCRYVWNASALVFLFDPLSFEGVYNRLSTQAKSSTQREGGTPMDNVDRLVDVLEKNGGLAPGVPVQIPVAFTLTKSDALAPPAGTQKGILDADNPILQPATHGSGLDLQDFTVVNEEVRSHLQSWQPGLLGHLEQRFKSSGFFAVSSLGSQPSGVTAPVPAPLRVEDPLLWILWKMKYIPLQPRLGDSPRRRIANAGDAMIHRFKSFRRRRWYTPPPQARTVTAAKTDPPVGRPPTSGATHPLTSSPATPPLTAAAGRSSGRATVRPGMDDHPRHGPENNNANNAAGNGSRRTGA
jgi:hypothetical protein